MEAVPQRCFNTASLLCMQQRLPVPLCLLLMCQSVVIFCDPRLKRVCFHGLRKGWVIGRGRSQGSPMQMIAALGKVSGPIGRALQHQNISQDLCEEERAKRVKVNSQFKLTNTQNNQVCSQNKRLLCCVSNDTVCTPLTW